MKREYIFAGVRELLRAREVSDRFTDAEVKALDAAIDWALAGKPGLTIGPEGIALIKQFEGCKLQAYPDPGTGGEPWTIGWGATHMHGRRVKQGDVITQAEADALLEEHLESYAAEVAKAIGDAPTTQPQFDALVSFHYNTGAIGRATLTKLHKAGKFDRAAQEFGKWIRAGGRPMKGLIRRRAAEAKLYRGEG